ncbi:hypothetical protein BC834DRAFT_870447 [Gloeopeniophorella convolvens]|nr:hypothetical protein BC834DRAFT_870447 [Gloeopeniophorella convolvens]
METSLPLCTTPPLADLTRKRTASPDTPNSRVKRSRLEPDQAQPTERDKKRRRKKKRLPVTLNPDTISDARETDLSPPLPRSPTLSAVVSPDGSQHGSTASSRPAFIQGSSSSTHLGPSDPIAKLYHLKGDNEQLSSRKLLQLEQTKPPPDLNDESLRDHKSLFGALIPSLVCQICLDLLHKPFALSPCGHVSCYSCLVNWFKADQRPDEPERGRIFRKKTCPQCRAAVRDRPIEAWNVKDMVVAVVKSGLAPDFPPVLESDTLEVASEGSSHSYTQPNDPWQNIFAPLIARDASPPLHGSLESLGMFDPEDQVYRCLDCMHEIWGGACSQCGRFYDGHDANASDSGSSLSHDEVQGIPAIWGMLPAIEEVLGWPQEDTVGSEDGSYEGSFIDDGEDLGGHAGDLIEVSSDDDNHTVIEGTTPAARRQGNATGRRTQIVSSDEDGNASDDSAFRGLRRRTIARQARQQIVSGSEDGNSDDDEEGMFEDAMNSEEDDGSLARPPMRLFGYSRHRHPSLVDEVDQESGQGHGGYSSSGGNGESGLYWPADESDTLSADEAW